MSTTGSTSALGNGEWLRVGSSIWSTDGSVEFKMQDDGKIAVYWGGQCRYQNTAEQNYNYRGVKVESDGNLAIYSQGPDPQVVWSTNLASGTGNSTVVCVVQNDGNVVLYKGEPIWSSNSYKSAAA